MTRKNYGPISVDLDPDTRQAIVSLARWSNPLPDQVINRLAALGNRENRRRLSRPYDRRPDRSYFCFC